MISRTGGLVYETLRSAVRLVGEGIVGNTVEAFGITERDYNLVTSETPWVASDRHRVRAILESLAFGSIDVVGLPRFPVPAEYLGGVICVFVSPSNIMIACRWLEGGGAETQRLMNGEQAVPSVSAEQLFALCLSFFEDDDGSMARERFEQRVGLALEKSKRKVTD